MKKKRARPRNAVTATRTQDPAFLLDTFTGSDLRRWLQVAGQINSLKLDLFYGLESERAKIYDQLLGVLRDVGGFTLKCQRHLPPLTLASERFRGKTILL